MNERVSYWLIPAEPDKSRCAQIIRDLALRFEAPEFEPHLTLYSGPRPGAPVETILEQATRNFQPLTLQTIGLGQSPAFTKTLFVEFPIDERLVQVGNDLRKLSVPSSPYVFHPHLSLVYAPLAAATRRRLAGDLSALSQIHFDSVKAVATGRVTRSQADVEAWRVLVERRL